MPDEGPNVAVEHAAELLNLKLSSASEVQMPEAAADVPTQMAVWQPAGTAKPAKVAGVAPSQTAPEPASKGPSCPSHVMLGAFATGAAAVLAVAFAFVQAQ
eukprot:347641-Chlamydomonas_euryale.AAC.1